MLSMTGIIVAFDVFGAVLANLRGVRMPFDMITLDRLPVEPEERRHVQDRGDLAQA